MKLQIYIALFFISLQIPAQCPSKEFVEQCAKGLKCDIVQTFEINIASKKEFKSQQSFYKLFLTKGITYEFYIFDSEDFEKQLVLSLFDAKENRLACTYNETSGMKSDKFRFCCKTSGEYSISYYPDKGKYCGMVLVGSAKKAGK